MRCHRMGAGVVNFLFRMMLTVSSTFWFVVIFGVRHYGAAGLVFLLVPVVLSLVSIAVFGFFDRDSMAQCASFVPADNQFLTVYFGYFFAAFFINDVTELFFVYVLVCLFLFKVQYLYFNPLFLVFGCHFYHVVTQNGTRVFLIVKGDVIRNASDMVFTDMRRINDMTYFVRRES